MDRQLNNVHCRSVGQYPRNLAHPEFSCWAGHVVSRSAIHHKLFLGTTHLFINATISLHLGNFTNGTSNVSANDLALAVLTDAALQRGQEGLPQAIRVRVQYRGR